MHEQYMKEALLEAEKALKNGDFPVGCVIVDRDKGIVSRGRRRNSLQKNEMDHAEILALRELYTKQSQGVGKDLLLYSTMEPCLMCYSTLILNNIHTIVYGYEDVMGGGTNLQLGELKPLYSHKEIQLIPHILRSECLQLFKDFFTADEIGYWQDSLLAQYTLNQT